MCLENISLFRLKSFSCNVNNNILLKGHWMTPEQVEQWKKERDIAVATGNEEAIKAVELHRAEMLMDCQQKTATRVKELIAKQNEISENFSELKASLKEQHIKLEEICMESNENDQKLFNQLSKMEKMIENNDLKNQLREAEIRGGKKTANWMIYVLGAVGSCGGGALLLKFITWLSKNPIQ